MSNRWNEEELRILKKYYPITTTENEMIELLPNRTYNSILLKANRLGLNKFWKEERIDGFKTCIKCKRELENDIRFFPPDSKGTKDGLRNVCRECGKDGHFMEDGYIPKRWWTVEENELFKERYPHYTNEELIEIHYPDESLKSLCDKAYVLGVRKSKETIERINKIKSEKLYGENSPLYGVPLKESTKKKLSELRKGKYIGENSWWFGRKRSEDQRLYMSKLKKKLGNWKGNNNPRHTNPLFGEENGRWKGGISELYQFLRRNLDTWKLESMKASNYKCVISDEEFDDIHHTYSFDLIVQDVLNELNLPVLKQVSDYTNDELDSILETFSKIHMDNIGVCLRRDIHILFHQIYGYGNNTPEQFEEFKINYHDGYYKDKLNTILTERRIELA